MVPTIFGLPAARIVHDECESDGHPACTYHLTWDRRSRLSWRRSRHADAEMGEVIGPGRLALDAHMGEHGSLGDLDLEDGVVQVARTGGRGRSVGSSSTTGAPAS